MVCTHSLLFHIRTVRSSPELTSSPVGRLVREYMKLSCPWSSPTCFPLSVHNRMMPSLPAEAKAAPEGCLGDTRHSVLTTSVLPLMVWRNLPVELNILMI